MTWNASDFQDVKYTNFHNQKAMVTFPQHWSMTKKAKELPRKARPVARSSLEMTYSKSLSSSPKSFLKPFVKKDLHQSKQFPISDELYLEQMPNIFSREKRQPQSQLPFNLFQSCENHQMNGLSHHQAHVQQLHERPAYVEHLPYSDALLPSDLFFSKEEKTPALIARSNSSSSVISCASSCCCLNTSSYMMPISAPNSNNQQYYWSQVHSRSYQNPCHDISSSSMFPGMNQYDQSSQTHLNHPISNFSHSQFSLTSSSVSTHQHYLLNTDHRVAMLPEYQTISHHGINSIINQVDGQDGPSVHQTMPNSQWSPVAANFTCTSKEPSHENIMALMCSYMIPIIMGFQEEKSTQSKSRIQRRAFLINILEHVFSSKRILKGGYEEHAKHRSLGGSEILNDMNRIFEKPFLFSHISTSLQIDRTNVILVALYLLGELRKLNRWSFTERQGADYRVFVAAMMLASKQLDDYSASAKTWSYASGVPLEELVHFEMDILFCLDFKIHVDAQRLCNWKAYIERCIGQHGQISQVDRRRIFTALRHAF